MLSIFENCHIQPKPICSCRFSFPLSRRYKDETTDMYNVCIVVACIVLVDKNINLANFGKN